MSTQSLNGVVAGNLVTSAAMAGLLRCLVHKGLLQAADIREVYESALLLLERQQGEVPQAQGAFEAARAMLEQQLS